MDKYISLMYEFKNDYTMELNQAIFSDLRVLKIFEYFLDDYNMATELIELIKYIPSYNSLVLRQEVLNDFLNNNIEPFYYKLVKLSSLYEQLKDKSQLIKKQIMTILYNYHYYIFLVEINEFMKSNKIQSNCLNNINKLIETELQKDHSKTIELYQKLNSKLEFIIEYKNNSPYYVIKPANEVSLVDELVDIASKLNINLVKHPRQMGKKEVSHFIIEEIIGFDKELLNEIGSYFQFETVTDLSFLIIEMRFYMSLKLLINNITKNNIPLSKVTFSDYDKLEDVYDLSLIISKKEIVPNDYNNNDQSFMQFILGVNSGGKTTYLRSVGLNYLLAMVCGFTFTKNATLQYKKYLYTHFPNEENYSIGEGRLKDEIKRISEMKKTDQTIIFFNETFSSTSEDVACKLTKELLVEINDTKTRMIYVTHQYKVFEDINYQTATFYTPVVDELDSNKKTYKIKKVQKELLTYVEDILRKHGLSKAQLDENLKRKKNESII